MDRAACYRLSPSGLSLFVRVTPNAGRDAIEGVELRDDGSAVLRLRVKAMPDKGKANAAVVALVAKALGVPKSAVSVVSGETARLKTLAVVGDGGVLAGLVEALEDTPS
ncbi:UPF0235 protein [Devosia yakushimensis]|uniref:UPF0235 protein GCM10007913_41060 n=1 Tax=Devosia yakushimensis TaxID=470028 RepID=A0ABQ5UJF5_9HYPH|nr:DUF167 family protein [Devosia yakushimensis]GLQ12173.1 UPF0235 protein [Devosia yakushimensis]